MSKLNNSALLLAKASNGNPVIATATIILFYIMFNTLESFVEILIYGKRFEHWLDIVFTSAFIAYSAYSVRWCAIYNMMIQDERELNHD